MTVKERLERPLTDRIIGYENDFTWGEFDEDENHPLARQRSNHNPSEIYQYVLYRLKLEDFERAELAREVAA